jgi:hypothetical protein
MDLQSCKKRFTEIEQNQIPYVIVTSQGYCAAKYDTKIRKSDR